MEEGDGQGGGSLITIWQARCQYKRGGGERRKKHGECPRKFFFFFPLPSVFTFQAYKIMQHSPPLWGDFFIRLRGNWEHWVTASFLILPPFLLLCVRASACVCVSTCCSFACAKPKQYGGDQLDTQPRGDGGGLQSLKISRAAERSTGLGRGNSASIPSISAVPAAFSTISKVLPYKLKTTEAVPDKMEKEKSSRLPRGSCFPSTRDVSAEAPGRFLLFFFPRRLDEEILGIPRLPCRCVAATERGDRP